MSGWGHLLIPKTSQISKIIMSFSVLTIRQTCQISIWTQCTNRLRFSFEHHPTICLDFLTIRTTNPVIMVPLKWLFPGWPRSLGSQDRVTTTELHVITLIFVHCLFEVGNIRQKGVLDTQRGDKLGMYLGISGRWIHTVYWKQGTGWRFVHLGDIL